MCLTRMEYTVSNNKSCYNLSDHDRMIVGISKVVANAVSVVACIFAILVIVTYKNHQANFQRILLYLSISFLINSINRILQGGSYKIIPNNEKYCQALGFLLAFTHLSIRISLVCIILELYLCMLLKKDTTRMKWIYLAAAYLIPAGVSWIPFTFRKFGLTKESNCYITYNTIDCTYDYTALVLIILLDWLPLGIAFIVVGPIYWFFLYCVWQQGKQYTPLVEVTRNTVYQQTIKDIGYFKWFPIPLFILNLFTITTTVISIYYMNTTLWSLSIFIQSLENGVVPLIGVYPTTLNWSSFKAAWRQKIMYRNVAETYPIIRAEHGDSVEHTDS